MSQCWIEQIRSAQRRQQKGTENGALNLELSTTEWLHCRRMGKKNLQKSTQKTILEAVKLTFITVFSRKLSSTLTLNWICNNAASLGTFTNNKLLLSAWSYRHWAKKKAQEQQMAHSQILVTRKAVKRIFKTSQCPQTIPRKFCLFFFFPIKMGPPSPTTEFGVNNDFTILNFIAFIFWR